MGSELPVQQKHPSEVRPVKMFSGEEAQRVCTRALVPEGSRRLVKEPFEQKEMIPGETQTSGMKQKQDKQKTSK